MAISDKYINYNLSLVDPNNIEIDFVKEQKKDNKINVEIENTENIKEELPIETEKVFYRKTPNTEEIPLAPTFNKQSPDIILLDQVEEKTGKDVLIDNAIQEREEIEIPSVNKIENKEEVEVSSELKAEEKISYTIFAEETRENKNEYDLVFEGKAEEKEEVNLSTFVLNEPRVLPEEEKDIDINKEIAHVGNIKEYPVDPIDDEVIVRYLDQDYERKKSSGDEPSKYFGALFTGNDAKLDHVDIMDLSSFVNKKLAKVPFSDRELTYDEIVKKLNIKGQTSNLGSLHVYPSNPNGENGILTKYTIPFEFNPKISENGVSAKYETTSLLSRIGDIYSYIKTDSASITLNTRYQVLSEEKSENERIDSLGMGLRGDNSGVGSWMESFHLRAVQDIEMKYRGLVYPQTSKSQGSFFRPPIVKIVFGTGKEDGETKGVSPFNNMLTYPYKLERETKVYYKTFIVSKVDIKKDWDNYPIILNDTHDGIIDLQGFDVSVSLLEIDPMYIGVLPSFEDYYSSFVAS